MTPANGSEHRRGVEREVLGSDIAEMDDLVHGGIERATVTLISGPAGVGRK